MADKNKGGRPPKFDAADELRKKIEEYFFWCDEQKQIISTDKGVTVLIKPYTVSGLCCYLDITRETLNQYEDKPEFSDTIKKAKMKIENFVEEKSLTGHLNPTVSIFNLKNNFGWKDKQELDMKSDNTNTNYNYEIDAKRFLSNATAAEKQKYESGEMTDREIAEIIGRR